MSVEKNVMENGLTVYGKRKVVTRTISIRRDQKELLKNISLFQGKSISKTVTDILRTEMERQGDGKCFIRTEWRPYR